MFGTRQGYDDVSGAVHMPGTQQKYYAKGNIMITLAKGNIIVTLAKCNFIASMLFTGKLIYSRCFA